MDTYRSTDYQSSKLLRNTHLTDDAWSTVFANINARDLLNLRVDQQTQRVVEKLLKFDTAQLDYDSPNIYITAALACRYFVYGNLYPRDIALRLYVVSKEIWHKHIRIFKRVVFSMPKISISYFVDELKKRNELDIFCKTTQFESYKKEYILTWLIDAGHIDKLVNDKSVVLWLLEHSSITNCRQILCNRTNITDSIVYDFVFDRVGSFNLCIQELLATVYWDIPQDKLSCVGRYYIKYALRYIPRADDVLTADHSDKITIDGLLVMQYHVSVYMLATEIRKRYPSHKITFIGLDQLKANVLFEVRGSWIRVHW